MDLARHAFRAGICGVLVLLTPALARAVDSPNLRGRWTRNAELSQDAVSKAFASLAQEGQGFSPDEQRFHDALLHFAKAIEHLQIEETAENVTVILADDEVQIYYPGGGPRARQGVLGGRLEVHARWQGDELVIKEKNEFGTLVQNLSLDRGGRLAVLLALDDSRLREPLLLLTVYDRVRDP
jgi:hypothetical protein